MQIEEVNDSQMVSVVASLARSIWVEHYTPIIGREQVAYMLSNFQSEKAVKKQMQEGYRYFLLKTEEGYSGYFGIIPDEVSGRLCLSKFYITRAARGRGLAREVMAFITKLCREKNIKTIWLTVNKRNPSMAVYERLGFLTKKELVTDIGAGFVMDDFVMEKTVEA